MKRIPRLLPIAPLVLFSTSAFAQSDAYKAGYGIGQQAGRFIGLAIPFLGVVLVIAAVWVGHRAWSKRRKPDDKRLQ